MNTSLGHANPVAIAFFFVFVSITLGITYWASRRTKTTAETRRTLSVIWGTSALPGRAAATEAWYRELLQQQGAATEAVASSHPA